LISVLRGLGGDPEVVYRFATGQQFADPVRLLAPAGPRLMRRAGISELRPNFGIGPTLPNTFLPSNLKILKAQLIEPFCELHSLGLHPCSGKRGYRFVKHPKLLYGHGIQIDVFHRKL
jgi:hypothetical protein